MVTSGIGSVSTFQEHISQGCVSLGKLNNNFAFHNPNNDQQVYVLTRNLDGTENIRSVSRADYNRFGFIRAQARALYERMSHTDNQLNSPKVNLNKVRKKYQRVCREIEQFKATQTLYPQSSSFRSDSRSPHTSPDAFERHCEQGGVSAIRMTFGGIRRCILVNRELEPFLPSTSPRLQEPCVTCVSRKKLAGKSIAPVMAEKLYIRMVRDKLIPRIRKNGNVAKLTKMFELKSVLMRKP